MNKNFKQKILSTLLAGCMCPGSFPAAFAAENVNANSSNNTATSPDSAVLSAFVPTELPIKMDSNGNITIPTNAVIVNGMDSRDILVSDIKVDMGDGWNGVSYIEDTYSLAADTQVMGLRFRGDAMQEDGSFTLTPDNWLIEAGQSLPLQMEAKIPKQTVAGAKGKIATIEYTLELADAHRIQVDWGNDLNQESAITIK